MAQMVQKTFAQITLEDKLKKETHFEKARKEGYERRHPGHLYEERSIYGEPVEEEIPRPKRKRHQTNIDADCSMQIQKMWESSYYKKRELVSAIVREFLRGHGFDSKTFTEVVMRDRMFFETIKE